MRKLLALTLVLALTGCASQLPTPTITPVDLKYCALSDGRGFDDDGLNRSVYAALQQLKVQTGASVMAIEVSSKLTPVAGLAKLVKANCDAIITSGGELAAPALAAAKNNKNVKFISVSDILNTGDSAPNFSALTFNIYQAAYAAGFLAASAATSGEDVAIMNSVNDFGSRKVIKAFTAGVERFNTKNRLQVKIVSVPKISQPTQGVVFVLAGNSEGLGFIDETFKGKIIGYGRDWYTDSRNKTLKPNILSSVIRIEVVSKVVLAVTQEAGSANFDMTNQGVGLSPAHDMAWPAGFSGELGQIVKDFEDGKAKVN